MRKLFQRDVAGPPGLPAPRSGCLAIVVAPGEGEEHRGSSLAHCRQATERVDPVLEVPLDARNNNVRSESSCSPFLNPAWAVPLRRAQGTTDTRTARACCATPRRPVWISHGVITAPQAREPFRCRMPDLLPVFLFCLGVVPLHLVTVRLRFARSPLGCGRAPMLGLTTTRARRAFQHTPF